MRLIHALRHEALVVVMSGALVLGIGAAGTWAVAADRDSSAARHSDFLTFSAPAGERLATPETIIDGVKVTLWRHAISFTTASNMR